MINKVKPWEPGTWCRNETEARQKLEGFVRACRDREYSIEERYPQGQAQPSYLVRDRGGSEVGEYTIVHVP